MNTPTNGDDILTGTSLSDTIDGLGGNDTISGGGGSDTLTGGAGDNILDGGGNVDTAVYSGQRSDYTVLNNGDSTYTVTGIEGTDTLSNIEQVQFSDGTFDIETIASAIITGTSNGEELSGTPGNDIINGLGGRDRIIGRQGNDELNGGDQDDEVKGGAGDDTLTGGDGNDTLAGEGDDDTLNGGAGDDTLEGGNGVDTAVFTGLRSDYLLVTNASGESVISGPDGTDTLDGIQFLTFDDGTFAIRDVNSGIINGSELRDTLTGGAASNTINGFGDDDRLRGEAGADTLNGGAGDDTIDGGNGRDTAVFSGSSGDYFIGVGGSGTSQTYIAIGPDGEDRLTNIELLRFDDGTFDIDDVAIPVLNGTAIGEFIRGTNDAEFIFGGDGNDRIEARRGDDYVDGGDGFDTLLVRGRASSYSVVDNFDDSFTITGPDGSDLLIDIEAVQFGSDARLISSLVDTVEGVIVNGTAASETLFGFELDDRLNGFGGDDTLRGRFGDDELNGGNGNDRLIGGIGVDLLEGGAGDDDLFGGRGNDTGVYSGDSFDYTVTRNGNGTYTVDGADGTDTLKNIESLSFEDGLFGIDDLVGGGAMATFPSDDFLFG